MNKNANASDTPRRPGGRPKSAKPRGIQSTSSSLDVLKVMLARDRPLHLREIVAELEREASSVYRYLVSFVEAGLVTQDEHSGRYDLGPMAVQLGLAALRRVDGLTAATDQLALLLRTIEADGHVTVWGSHGPTVLRWMGGPSDVVVRVREGTVLPLTTSATGRLWITFMPQERLKAALERELGEMPSRSRQAAAKELSRTTATIRDGKLSYSYGERRPDVDALAAPVFDRSGSMVFAITLVGTGARLSPETHPDVGRQLLSHANTVSQLLGAPPS